MVSTPDKPSGPAKQQATAPDRSSGDILDTVVEQLRALREDVIALRDEVRAMGQRRPSRRERPRRDPGDAVPPGVAVQDPEPLSTNERNARRNLERLSRE